MRKTLTIGRWILAAAGCACHIVAMAQQDPAYFTHDFEDKSLYPESKTSAEQAFGSPYGEWIYSNVSSSTNTKYLRDGMGSRDLRMPKNTGCYVILPVMDRGAKELSFMEGRGGRQITVYTSSDGGTTWDKLTAVTTDKDSYANTVSVNDIKTNRIKLTNEGSADADVDNICVTILAAGTKATLSTGTATDITRTTATVSGTLDDPGDKDLVEMGICWSATNRTPSTADNKVKAAATPFAVSLTGLPAGKAIHYRAYAITGAGTGYGEVRSFDTTAPTTATLSTKTARMNPVSTDGKTMAAYTGGTVTDNGGDTPAAVGVVFATTPLPTTADSKATGVVTPDGSGFDAIMRLLPNTTYHYRAFATNTAGTSYGDEKSLTTGDLVIAVSDGNIIHCAPDGNDNTADGSENYPFRSLQKAADMAQPGDTIYMKAGTYTYDARIDIMNSGTDEKPIALLANGGRAVLDFSAMPYHSHSDNPYQGVRLCGSYWHIFGLDITNASDNGMLIERNKPTGGSSTDIANATEQAHDNIIEQCNFYRNGDTGLQMKNLAANNAVLNCDSYLNCDEGQGDADGFAPKISVGDGNYFYGCRAWCNSDDGWDVFFKKDGGFGDNVTVVLDNCISYKNGFLDENTTAPNGNGNGFKMGSDQGAMNVYMNRCLAVCNKAKGFDQNHNAGDIIMNNCTGMTLTSISNKAYSYRIYESIAGGHSIELTNCVAINDNAATDHTDSSTGLPVKGQDGKYGLYGRFEVDSTLAGMKLTTNEFRHAAPSEFADVTNHSELVAPRAADGSLPPTTFAHPAETSALIDRGTPVAGRLYRGIAVNGIEYDGTAPDLGAYESGLATAVAKVSATSGGADLRARVTRGGMLLLNMGNAAPSDKMCATVTDAAGRILARHNFTGPTTAVAMPHTAANIIVIRVEGGCRQAACVKLPAGMQ